jgi:hypothetical protein
MHLAFVLHTFRVIDVEGDAKRRRILAGRPILGVGSVIRVVDLLIDDPGDSHAEAP